MTAKELQRILTPTEVSVLRLRGRGFDADEIADRLRGGRADKLTDGFSPAPGPAGRWVLRPDEVGPVIERARVKIQRAVDRERRELEMDQREEAARAAEGEDQQEATQAANGNGGPEGSIAATPDGPSIAHQLRGVEPVAAPVEPAEGSWAAEVLAQARARVDRYRVIVDEALTQLNEAEAVIAAITGSSFPARHGVAGIALADAEPGEPVEVALPDPSGDDTSAGIDDAAKVAAADAEREREVDPDGGFDDGPGGEQTHFDPPPTGPAAKAAKRDQTVVDFLRENGPTPAPAIRDATGIPDGSWPGVVQRLRDRVEVVRSEPSPKGGRVKIFDLTEGERGSRPSEPAPATKVSGREPEVAEVRKAIVHVGRFTPQGISVMYCWDEVTVEAIVRYLLGLGTCIEEVEPGVFRYVEPSELPPAKRVKREPPEVVAVREAGRLDDRPVRGKAIDGTGKQNGKPSSKNPDVQLLLDECENYGATLRWGGSGHIRVELPNGETASVASTPSSPAGTRDDRAKIRRLGLPV